MPTAFAHCCWHCCRCHPGCALQHSWWQQSSASEVAVCHHANYGQSYYEIFNRGNYDHNVVFTHPVNAPSLRQMLAIDATFGRTTLRIGYLVDIRQSNVNNIKAHTYTHAFVLGFTRKFSVQNL